MSKRNAPSAKPPELHSFEIPGGTGSLDELRKADRETRPPQAEYERGSTQDRAGNRGR